MKIEVFEDKALVAVKSTANLWIRLYDAFEEHGIQVVLSNPSKNRLIAEARVKTDNYNEPYRGENCVLSMRKLKDLERISLVGLLA